MMCFPLFLDTMTMYGYLTDYITVFLESDGTASLSLGTVRCKKCVSKCERHSPHLLPSLSSLAFR